MKNKNKNKTTTLSKINYLTATHSNGLKKKKKKRLLMDVMLNGVVISISNFLVPNG